MKKILGLDLGTNSIGYALIQTDNENYKLNDFGTCRFPESLTRQKNLAHLRTLEKLQQISIRDKVLIPMVISFLILTCVNYNNWQFWIGLGIASLLTMLSKDR
ncbi:MAG: hypothetical protein ACK5M7_15760 [Draconibacterium sp.]